MHTTQNTFKFNAVYGVLSLLLFNVYAEKTFKKVYLTIHLA